MAAAPLRVLVVEDEVKVARTLARMLAEDGFEVETAFDGAGAIARLGRDPMPDVLVVDYRLPHVDGLVVANYARSRSPGLPVILITSYPEVVRDLKPKLDPLPVMLIKPLNARELTTELTRVQDLRS